MWKAVILLLSVYVLIALLIETIVTLPAETSTLLTRIDNAICLLFIGDFFYNLFTAGNKLAYLKWGWIDLVSSIPNVEFLRWGRFVRVIRILRILRGVRSTRLIVKHLFENRARSTFATVAMISFVLLVFSTIVILNCETSSDSNIKSAGDALWWSIVTMATVGYGDKYPVTSIGRVVGVFLMISGVGLFGTFTAYVASFFVKSVEKDERKRDEQMLAELKDIRERLDRMEREAPVAEKTGQAAK